jgi:predicted nucleic acid-binding protein
MAISIAIDANVVICYLTGDDPLQSPAATELFRAAQAGKVKLLIPTSTIQETVYVLERLDKHVFRTINSIGHISNEQSTEPPAHSDGRGQGEGGLNFAPAAP